ncbi:RNA polymerase II subunit 5-mediating protein-like [Vitis vinifera]|uniref:RNA polymerase II subunit 5-mediating protein-like n=1 Tax=Vitis vinifera TaxID=29760 RepID=A0A438EGM4_VITVI|nr:RNA polymerase II subunit 5-mediating protein-like [Vitis vinifera]
MQEPVKGTVTPLASLFPPEEAQKASKRVQDALADRQSELDRLQGFIADNTALVNLVQRLPDELHHDIMAQVFTPLCGESLMSFPNLFFGGKEVPFGKAAFFPGRLVHTNEFLVLLGEGYYAERTSKQTVEILDRRGKALESQVDSLKAMMKDLKAEVSFFDATAAEAVEGLVEIREDYVEESSSERVIERGTSRATSFPSYAGMRGPPKPDSPRFSGEDSMKVAAEDEEYARMMLRFDELEKEELAAGSGDEHDEDEHNEADVDHSLSQLSGDHVLGSLEERQVRKPLHHSKDEYATTEELLSKKHFEEDFANQLKSKIQLEGLKEQSVPKDSDGVSHGKSFANRATQSSSHGKDNIQALPTSKAETSVQSSKPATDSLKACFVRTVDHAFTGSIVEHTRNIQMNPREQAASSSQSSGSQPTKPVSRFKMQRR